MERLHGPSSTCSFPSTIEDFLKAFAAVPDELTEFTLESWHGLVDYGTVYAADGIRFTFKNGQEVKA